MKKLSSLELQEATISIAPFCKVYAADRDYALPTLGWLLKTFYPWFQGEMFRIVANKWAKRFDCDNFAQFFAAWAAVSHWGASQTDRPEGLAVGECWYKQDSVGGHAINIAVTEEDGEQVVAFIEPQNGKRLKLSQMELYSIWLVKF